MEDGANEQQVYLRQKITPKNLQADDWLTAKIIELIYNAEFGKGRRCGFAE